MSNVDMRAFIAPPTGTLVDPDINMRASIPQGIDTTRYVATIDRALNRTNGTHSAHILGHTNGNLYAVWAEKGDVAISGTNRAHVLLFFASSGDQGLTWSSPLQLFTPTSNGELFLFPQLIQLTQLTTSNIGLVFNWFASSGTSPVVQTAVINQSGSIVTSKATLPSSTNELRPRVAYQNGGGFIILALNQASTSPAGSLASRNSIKQWVTSGVFTGTWTLTTGTITSVFIVDHDLLLLQNGDLLHLYSYTNSTDGDTTNGGIRANISADLGYRVWNSGGGSFGSSTQLTSNYSAISPGIRTSLLPLSVSINEITANTIEVAFGETNAITVVNNSTAVGWAATSTSTSFTTGWPGLDLVATYISGTNPGLYIINFREGVITRLHTGSTPALSSNSLTDASFSYDGKFLAVASNTNLLILATNGSTNPNQWTIWLTLTTSSTPALRTENISVTQFQPNSYILWVGYGISGASIAAVINNISLGHGATITGCVIPSLSAATRAFNVEGSYAIIQGGSDNLYIFNLNGSYKGPGLTSQSETLIHNLAWSGFYGGADHYWSTNDTNSGVQTFTYDGTTMVLDQNWTTSSTPAIFTNPGSTGGSTWSLLKTDNEIMAFQSNPLGFIAFFKPDKSMSNSGNFNVLDYTNPTPWPSSGQVLAGWYDPILDVYYVQTAAAQFYRVPRRKGLIRRASYPYASHALTTSGVTAYQAESSVNTDISYYRNHFFVKASQGWQLYGIRQKNGMSIAGGFVISNTTKTLQSRARISVKTIQTLQFQSKIALSRFTETIRLRALIAAPIKLRARVSRQQGWPLFNIADPGFPLFQPTQLQARASIKQTRFPGSQSHLMRAKIFKGATRTLQTRAFIVSGQSLSIKASITPRQKSNVLTNSFYVNSARSSVVSMLFYVNGNLGLQDIGIRAQIAKIRTTKLTSHFLVYNTPSASKVISFDFASQQHTEQTLTMKARIVVP